MRSIRRRIDPERKIFLQISESRPLTAIILYGDRIKHGSALLHWVALKNHSGLSAALNCWRISVSGSDDHCFTGNRDIGEIRVTRGSLTLLNQRLRRLVVKSANR